LAQRARPKALCGWHEVAAGSRRKIRVERRTKRPTAREIHQTVPGGWRGLSKAQAVMTVEKEVTKQLDSRLAESSSE